MLVPCVLHPVCAACCSLFMGNIELPGGATGSKQTIKMPVGTYEFGANLISEKGVSKHTLAMERLLAYARHVQGL